MEQHRCTSRLRAIWTLFSCSSRLGLRSTKPRLTKEQHRCTLQLNVRTGKLLIFWSQLELTQTSPQPLMVQHRCTSPLCIVMWKLFACSLRLRQIETSGEAVMGQHQRGTGKRFSCWSRRGMRSTQPQLKQGQHPCTLQSRMRMDEQCMHDGATPLYIAAQRGRLLVVRWLVQAGVEIDKATTLTHTHTSNTLAHCSSECAKVSGLFSDTGWS